MKIPSTAEMRNVYASVQALGIRSGPPGAIEYNHGKAKFDRWLAQVEREAAARAIAEAAEEVDALTSEYTATAERLSEGKEWADSNRYFGYASGSNRAAAIVRARAAEMREGKGDAAL